MAMMSLDRVIRIRLAYAFTSVAALGLGSVVPFSYWMFCLTLSAFALAAAGFMKMQSLLGGFK